MPDEMRPAPVEALPTDVRILRARWTSLREAAPAAEPHATLGVLGSDLNGVGLLYFAGMLRFLRAGEAAATAPFRLPPVLAREVHWYGNADLDDALHVSCDLHVVELGRSPVLAATLALRRKSDDGLVAVCTVSRGEE
jgi:probable biosynthetic protein (TIGR04098 family)